MPSAGPAGPVAPRPRRHPRYLRFLLSGALLGLVATAVVVLGRGEGAEDVGRVAGYLAVVLVGLGALLGGLVAVLVEGRRR